MSPDAVEIDAPEIDAAEIDAPEIDAPEIDALPVGVDHGYVISRVILPRSVNEATRNGLDVDDRPGDTQGGIDNSLGTSLGTFAGQGIDLQPNVDRGVARGVPISLLRLRAPGLGSAEAAALWLHRGLTSTPSPCDGPTDPICGRHLTGVASFTLAGDAPLDQALIGPIVGGIFAGGPGLVVLRLTLSADGPPMELPLHRAKARFELTAAGQPIAGIIAGAIPQADFEAHFHPAMRDVMTDLVDRDCAAPPRTPPACGCVSGTTGATVLGLFDTAAPRDCAISTAEVTAFLNPIINQDIDLDGDGTNDAVSLGLRIEAVFASVPAP